MKLCDAADLHQKIYFKAGDGEAVATILVVMIQRTLLG
jgi:hypothetical protein